MKKKKKINVESRQDIHSIIEYVMDLAMFRNKVGSTTFSIPYYDLIEDAENFDPVYLNIEIKTSWDTTKLDTVFIEEQEQQEEEQTDDNKKRTASPNKKH